MEKMEDLELKIAKFLRLGVLVSGILIFVGWLMKFKLGVNPFYVFQDYDQISLPVLLRHYWKRRDWGVLISYAGMAALISLPIIRVMLTGVLFLKQKEHHLAIITLIVLLGLIGSFFLGVVH